MGRDADFPQPRDREPRTSFANRPRESPGTVTDFARFRRLVAWTAGTTFALIVIGGVVRISDSGLGCGAAGSGTRGWPLCGGRLVPLVKTTMIVEYTHRIVAALVVGLLVERRQPSARLCGDGRPVRRGPELPVRAGRRS